MKISEIQTLLQADVLNGIDLLDLEIEYGWSCDLMSDVLAFVKNDVVLLTGLVHPQVIRTAEMLDIKAIVFVRGKKPGDEIIRMARDREIVILATDHTLYTASALLHIGGLAGEEGIK